jgi:predicted dienelactone hydrolase
LVQRGTLVATLIAATGSPVAAAAADATAQHYQVSRTQSVETVKFEWKDAKRDREVPVKIYYPKTGSGPFPIIIFSHGLGGTRDAYEYLGRHWASHGYVSVHLQHIGSDDDVWRNVEPSERMKAMRRSAANPQNSLNRPLDVSFAIDQITRLNREAGPFQGRLDLNRIGAAGHSFGAYTTLAVAGQVFVGPFVDGKTLADPRVKAAVPMSAPVPSHNRELDRVFGKIQIPCLHMTGTKDNSPIGNTPAEDRRLPFDHSNGADQYLIIFENGDHMIFSGRGRLAGGENDEQFHALIRESTLAFWDAYLRGDSKAKAWLAGGGFERVLGKDGTFEKKLKPRS